MRNLKYLIVAAFAAVALTACGAPATNTPANNANGNSNSNVNASAKTTAAAPTKEALMTLEKSGWEAWKNRDPKWIEANYAAKGFNLGSTGRQDQAAMMKSYTTQKCEIKSYSLSDDQLHMAGPDVAILTFKGTQDGTCDGKKVPETVWSASVYVREGDKWKAFFYGEAPAVDAKAPVKPATAPPAAKKDEATPAETKPDAATEALFAVEKKAWEDWKNKDAKGLDEFASSDMISLVQPDGWSAREATLKNWVDPSCDVKSVSLSDPASVALGADYALLTFKAGVDGKCGTDTLKPEWGATIYGKQGTAWKAIMTFGTPSS